MAYCSGLTWLLSLAIFLGKRTLPAHLESVYEGLFWVVALGTFLLLLATVKMLRRVVDHAADSGTGWYVRPAAWWVGQGAVRVLGDVFLTIVAGVLGSIMISLLLALSGL